MKKQNDVLKFDKENIIIELPPKVKQIIDQFEENGFEAFAVGGCVRDSLLGANPYDWDITTNALPQEIKTIFKKTVDTGIKHGTVTVIEGADTYEVTTYRIDGEYEDNRRPNDVIFASKINLDLERRDFTINAMAYNESMGLIDLFGGIDDLNKKVIRCVGIPEERFKEDGLRMIRALRFSAVLGFEIEEKTKEAIIDCSSLIKNISGERIRIELSKTLMSNNPDRVKMLYELGLMEYVLPEFIPCIGLVQNNPYHAYNVDEHIYRSIENIDGKETLRWAMLLHDIGKGYSKTTDKKGVDHFGGHVEKSCDIGREILNRLKFDNKTKDSIIRLIKYHDYRVEPNKKAVRKALNTIGDELFEDYIRVQKADILSQNPNLIEERIKKLENIIEIYEEIIKDKECTKLKDLKITGRELLEIGFSQGKEIGIILNLLLESVIENPERNNEEWLLHKAKEVLTSRKAMND